MDYSFNNSFDNAWSSDLNYLGNTTEQLSNQVVTIASLLFCIKILLNRIDELSKKEEKMQTKFNIGDEVYIEAEVIGITINKCSETYRVQYVGSDNRVTYNDYTAEQLISASESSSEDKP